MNLTSISWLIRNMRPMDNIHPNKSRRALQISENDSTPPHSNVSKHRGRLLRLKTTLVYSVEHELQTRNHLPATNLEQEWIIHSGASAHMTPFKKECYEIHNTSRRIFLADGSFVICT